MQSLCNSVLSVNSVTRGQEPNFFRLFRFHAFWNQIGNRFFRFRLFQFRFRLFRFGFRFSVNYAHPQHHYRRQRFFKLSNFAGASDEMTVPTNVISRGGSSYHPSLKKIDFLRMSDDIIRTYKCISRYGSAATVSSLSLQEHAIF